MNGSLPGLRLFVFYFGILLICIIKLQGGL